MPRSVALLLLTLALAGPLLTLAEAASDFGRSLAELAHPRGVEAIDDGVGDEPIVTCATKDHPGLDPVSVSVPFDEPALVPVARPMPVTLGMVHRQRKGVSLPAATARERHAWLQLFLF